MIERGAQTSQWGILGSDEEVSQPAIEDDLFDEDESEEDEPANADEDEGPADGPAAARG